MRIALHAGQLLQPVPGGIGQYVRSLLRELPRQGIEPVAFAAGARPRAVPNGVAYVDLGWPHGSVRYELWHRVRRPELHTDAALVHAPSLAVPPSGGRPLIVTAHDIAFHRFPENTTRRGRAFHERGLVLARRHAALVLAPSDFTRRELLDLGFAPDRVATAHLGVDPPRPVSADAVDTALERLQLTGPFVLAVGTVEPRKRLRLLVQAHRAVRATLGDVALAIVGPDGWGDVGDLRGPGVHRFGRLPWDLVDALYRRAAVFAIPSVYEGFGLPAVEAMARGCPVVAAGGSALDEVIGGAGTVVRPDDEDALAEALIETIVDTGRRGRMIEIGYQQAAAYTWTRTAREHARLYNQVVADR